MIVPKSPTVVPDELKVTSVNSSTFTLVGSEVLDKVEPFSKKSLVLLPSRSSIPLKSLYETVFTFPSAVTSKGDSPANPSLSPST